MTAATSLLSPAHQRVTEDLLGLYEERPLAKPSWAPELRSCIEAAFADHVSVRFGSASKARSPEATAGLV